MIKLIKTCCASLAVLLTAVSVTVAAGTESVSGGFKPMTAETIGDLRIINTEALESREEFADMLKKEKKVIADSKEYEGSTAYLIKINGKDTVYVPTEVDAENVIKGIIASYQTPGSEVKSYAFAEEISYEEKDIVTAKEAKKNKKLMETYVCDAEEAVRFILNGTSVPVTYTVQGGDTLWDIAAASNISVYELEQMNPGVATHLTVGQTVNLYQKNPMVHVTLTESITEVQSIPYDTKYNYSNNLYRGQVKVTSVGEAGSKEVTTEISKQDGIEIARNVVSENVIKAPVTQVASAGTKTVPIQAGSGQLQYPVAKVEISSGYGSRGGGFHRGIDLRAPRGTAIMAADSGTVTQTGYCGTYGNLIVINHGGGVVTKYAHCDTIAVSVGQRVQKGQFIGTIGKTGNATGYHVHFEVVVNGVTKNPLNYL